MLYPYVCVIVCLRATFRVSRNAKPYFKLSLELPLEFILLCNDGCEDGLQNLPSVDNDDSDADNEDIEDELPVFSGAESMSKVLLLLCCRVTYVRFTLLMAQVRT